MLAFKVKTTAPKVYHVRPNAAVVGPNELVKVDIYFKGWEEEPGPGFVCRDKFLVVWLPCPYTIDESVTVAQLWPKLELEFKAASKSKKVRVEFVLGQPEGTVGGEAPSEAVPGVPGSTDLQAELEELRGKVSAMTEKMESNKAQAAVRTAPAPEQSLAFLVTLALVLLLLAFILAYIFF